MIRPYAFADLQDLHALHLDANRLTSLDDAHFQGLVNLLGTDGNLMQFPMRHLSFPKGLHY